MKMERGQGQIMGPPRPWKGVFVIWFQIAIRKRLKKTKSISLKATLAARGDGPVDNRGQDGVGGMMELETRDI